MTREEGFLSDPVAQRERQKADALANSTNRGDLLALERSANFRRWFGKFAETTLMLNLQTNNGGDLQHFAGRRGLLLEMIKEFEDEVPGFYERVLAVRRALKNELRPEPQEEN